MASSVFTLTLFSLLLLLHQPNSSIAQPHRKVNAKRFSPKVVSQLSTPKHIKGPIQFFEVTKPIELPNTEPCSHAVLSHNFGYTYGKPPVLSDYTPPSHCRSREFSKIVLEWRSTCRGTQFDRIFGVWLAGVELLRSCTAEPTSSGIVWTVEKDVTRYHSLLLKNETQTLAVFLGNIVDQTYTGVYHVNLTLHFYPAMENPSDFESEKSEGLASGYRSWADLVLPISRNPTSNDGLWFEMSDSVGTQFKEFNIPRNAYRAVLEVYVSFHENDEFWYSNLPNEYISENALTDVSGNGPFREIVVSLDGEIAGAVWPFTVIYTGGINPLLWRPVSGIGSFNLPSYEIEITPFLGKILDGKNHTFGFSVTNALNVWFVDANLHVWLDKHRSKTEGRLLKHIASPLVFSQDSDFEGLNGKFLTTASRTVLAVGSIRSSFGSIVTSSIQEFSYSNSMVLKSDGNKQIIDQTVFCNDTVHVEMPFLDVYLTKSEKTFPLLLSTDFVEQSSGDSYLFATNLTLGFHEKKSLRAFGVEFQTSSVKNEQIGLGYLLMSSDGTGASASTRQVYDYEHGDCCYSRNISSKNYVIAYDEVNKLCRDQVQLPLNLLSSGQGFSNV